MVFLEAIIENLSWHLPLPYFLSFFPFLSLYSPCLFLAFLSAYAFLYLLLSHLCRYIHTVVIVPHTVLGNRMEKLSASQSQFRHLLSKNKRYQRLLLLFQLFHQGIDSLGKCAHESFLLWFGLLFSDGVALRHLVGNLLFQYLYKSARSRQTKHMQRININMSSLLQQPHLSLSKLTQFAALA